MGAESLPLLLVEDHPLTQQGIAEFLKIQGYAVVCVGDAQTARTALSTHTYHGVILDITIPPSPGSSADNAMSEGLGLLRYCKQLHPDTGVVIFSAHMDRGDELRQLIATEKMRKVVYLHKGRRPRDLLQALEDVQIGKTQIDAEVTTVPLPIQLIFDLCEPNELIYMQRVLEHLHGNLLDGRPPALTPKEMEVARAVAHGLSNNEIAIQMAYSSSHSVENLVSIIYSKVDLHRDEHQGKWRPDVLLAKAILVYELHNRLTQRRLHR
jgi:DNA-binding NarL/FixJ family response regulator